MVAYMTMYEMGSLFWDVREPMHAILKIARYSSQPHSDRYGCDLSNLRVRDYRLLLLQRHPQ